MMNRVFRITAVALAISATSCGGGAADELPCGIVKVDKYTLGSKLEGCVGRKGDVHAYKIKAPSDSTGGYVKTSVMGAGAGTLRLTAYAGDETTELGRFAPVGVGAATTFFLAVLPGQIYRLEIADDGGFIEPYTFTLATTYTPVPDRFEPNNNIGTATPLVIGAGLQAFLFAGRVSANENVVDFDDFYRFSAVSGSVTIRIEDVPLDVAPRLTLYGSDGMEAARTATGIKGGTVVLQTAMLPGPQDPILRVAPWSDAPQSMGPGATLPDHFTRPYKLTVTQP